MLIFQQIVFSKQSNTVIYKMYWLFSGFIANYKQWSICILCYYVDFQKSLHSNITNQIYKYDLWVCLWVSPRIFNQISTLEKILGSLRSTKRIKFDPKIYCLHTRIFQKKYSGDQAWNLPLYKRVFSGKFSLNKYYCSPILHKHSWEPKRFLTVFSTLNGGYPAKSLLKAILARRVLLVPLNFE